MQVSVTEVPGSAATSHYAVAVRVTNTSDQPCEVSGYPGFSQISAGAVLGAPADRADAAVNRIVLRAGQAGVATVQVTKGEPYEGVAACQMTPFVAWRVYLPNQTEAIDVPAQGFGCANPQTHLLTVRPFEAA